MSETLAETPPAPSSVTARRAPRRAKLTKRVVDALDVPSRGDRPNSEGLWLWDTEVTGFAVRAWPTGRKVYMYVYRLPGDGRQAPKRKVTIGEHGKLTVEEARREARRLAGRVASGHCPATERRRGRDSRAAERAAATVNTLLDDFLVDRRAKKKASTVDEYERLLARDVRPKLGARKVADVTRAQIAKLHLDMAARPYLANRVLAVLHAAFTFAERQEMRPRGTNPCTDVEPYPERSRDRCLSETEFARLGDALTRAERSGLPTPEKLRRRPSSPEKAKHRPKTAGTPKPANTYAVAVIRFLLLSGWREREALTLKREYLDEAHGIARLPDTKTGRSVRALGAAAWQLLKELPKRDDSPYVFPGAKKDEPLKETKRVWEAARLAAGLPDVRLHDLRHSHASVGVGDLGLSLPVIGALLGHTEWQTTQRYAHLADDPRKRAADAVADRVASLLAAPLPNQPPQPTVEPTAPPSTAKDAKVLPFRRRA